MARCNRSAGVEEQGIQARVQQEPGSSRDLLDDNRRERAALNKWPWPTVVASMTGSERSKRRESRYGAVTVTERRGTDHEKSELVSSTDETGEPDRRDPVEGRRRRI